MSKIRKAQAYYLDIKNKKKYFPSNVLNWQLLGKFLGQVPNVIGENQARFFCEKRHQKTKEFLKLHFDEFVENYNFKIISKIKKLFGHCGGKVMIMLLKL